MKKKIAVAVIVILFIIASYLILTGFRERTDVYLIDFSVSESGDEITLSVGVSSSMGYIRGYKDEGGGVKPHYLNFYSTFGGLNSSLGAKSEFVLEVDENDTEIWFCRPDGGYEIVLVKSDETGEWLRPARGGTPLVVDEASDSETFEVNAEIKGIQVTGMSILTNTETIRISAEDIREGVEISPFLYNAENTDTPILYATLTSEKPSVDFSNLTSACAYKVGAEIMNADKSVTLTITD